MAGRLRNSTIRPVGKVEMFNKDGLDQSVGLLKEQLEEKISTAKELFLCLGPMEAEYFQQQIGWTLAEMGQRELQASKKVGKEKEQ